MKHKKILIIPVIILFIFVALGITYYIGFYPKNSLVPITSEKTLQTKHNDLIKKISLKDFSFSIKNKDLNSKVLLNEEDLTDIILNIIKKNQGLSDYITGVKASISNNEMILNCNLIYKNIPVKSKIIFTAKAKNGNGILHLNEIKVGFLKIPNSFIFSKLNDNSFIKFDKNNSDIILSSEKIMRNTSITNFSFNNENKLEIIIKGPF